jgi:hypothetical protein
MLYTLVSGKSVNQIVQEQRYERVKVDCAEKYRGLNISYAAPICHPQELESIYAEKYGYELQNTQAQKYEKCRQKYLDSGRVSDFCTYSEELF